MSLEEDFKRVIEEFEHEDKIKGYYKKSENGGEKIELG